ncbi:MAG: hypothetical protein CVT47_02320 [Thermoplasmata archaeon HGW-Thermoplasmata-2]|nr:MAG: hypothetical protein CVT47_02320 [Thermoplasmata archaeon HGW-Thermoplasmata-2]
MQTVKIGSSEIFLLGTIHGLVSEKEKVKSAFNLVKPEALALAVPSEDIPALAELSGGGEYEKREPDDAFLKKLSKYGAVELPPADLLEAHGAAKKLGIPVYAVDLDDAAYADAFCKHVSAWSLVRQSFRLKRMARRKYKVKTAEEFALEWDRLHNKVNGYRRLEEAREKKIAAEIRALAEKHKKILAVVDLQREKGIIEKLK